MFGVLKKMFILLLSNLVKRSNHTKCLSLSNQKCMIQPTLINLHRNEYIQEFYYCPFAVKLDLKKTEDLSLSVFNMITGRNESNIFTKNTSCEYKCRFD